GNACRAADPIRSGRQHENREGSRHQDSAVDPPARRQGDRMTTRREFLGVGVYLSAAPLAALAQQRQEQVGPIGFLSSTNPSSPASIARVGTLRAGLRDLGYVEGRNLAIEFRWAEDNTDRLPALAAELVRLKVDVIVSQGTPATLAAKRATS